MEEEWALKRAKEEERARRLKRSHKKLFVVKVEGSMKKV